MHFKKVPLDPAIEERWAKYGKEQEEAKKKQEEEKKNAEEEKKKKDEEKKANPDATVTTTEKTVPSVTKDKEDEKEESKTEKKPEPPKKPLDEKFKRISPYNGDVLDRYTWGQGVWDVTVQVPLPTGTKPKMVYICILNFIS